MPHIPSTSRSLSTLLRGVLFFAAVLPVIFSLSAPPCLRAEEPRMTLDASITEYRLPNGLKVILRDEGPSARETAVWLRIGAGSADEPFDAQGAAHFIEHMAFNGTKRFPGGALTDALRNAGLTPGADHNAETGLRETVYQYTIQNGRSGQAQLILDALNEIARNLTFDPDRMDKERAVILEEMRLRGGPQQRSFGRLFAALFPGARLAQSPGIGTADSIKTMSRDALIAFYRQWYVPGNTTILISGNLAACDFREEIETRFASWQGAPPARQLLAVSNPPQLRFNLCIDPELPESEVTFVRVNAPEPVTNAASLRATLVRQIAARCLAARLENAVETGESPAAAATVTYDNLFGLTTFESAVATGKGPDWPETVQYLAAEIHRANAGGFSEEEIAAAREQVLAKYRSQASFAGSLAGGAALRVLLARESRGEPPWDAASLAALAATGADTIQAEEINAAFRSNLGAGDWLVSVETPDDGGCALTEAMAQKLIDSAGEMPLPAIRVAQRLESLLDQPPPEPQTAAGPVTEAGGVASLKLPNGLVVNQKVLPRGAGEVILRLTIPGGEIEETQANRGITDLTAFALNRMATADADAAAVRAWLKKEGIQIMAAAETDALTVTITAPRERLAKAMETARALLLRARVTPEAVAQWGNEKAILAKMENANPTSQALWAVRGMLFGGDPRKSRIPDENIRRFQTQGAQAWLDHLRGAGGMELALIGAEDAAEGFRLAAACLGDPALDPLRAAQIQALRNARPARSGEIQVLTAPASGDAVAGETQAAVMIAFPGASFQDGQAASGLGMLGRILTKRLLDTLREKEGLVYALQVMSETGDAYPERGGFVINGLCDPARAAEVAQKINAEVARLAAQPLTDAEIAQAETELRSEETRRRELPMFAARQLSRLAFRGYDPATLEPPAATDRLTAGRLREIAQKFLAPEKRIVVIARPGPAATAANSGAPAAENAASGINAT